MNSLGIFAALVIGVWTGVLTLVVLLLVRQVGLLTVQVSRKSPAIDTDGPKIGRPVPREVLTMLPRLHQGQTHILLLSATCGPCREIATALSRNNGNATSVLALIAGRAELAQELGAMLPPQYQVVHDPGASEVADALYIHSTPFSITVTDGIVSGKSYLRSANEFLAQIHERTASENVSHPQLEVHHVG